MTAPADRLGPDRGASLVGYTSVIALVGGIVVAVLGANIPESVADLISDSACAIEDGDPDCDGALPPDHDEDVPVELVITVRADSNSPAREWTLTCDPPGGSHPKPKAACTALRNADHTMPEPVPDGELCTMQHGGPNTATISGTIDGAEINADFNRVGGCEISRWNDMGDLIAP